MVTIYFKLTTHPPLSLPVNGKKRLRALLEPCLERIEGPIESYIVLVDGKVMQVDEDVHDGQRIEIFPALSGG